MIITSKNNETFKYFKKLKNKKYRQEEKLFMVEKPVVITEAEDFIPEYIVISESEYIENKFEDILKKYDSKKIYIFADNLFLSISDAITPPGIIAYYKHLDKKFNKKNGKYLYLDDIQEPGNLGGIIRSADALGLDGIILSPNCCDLYNPKTVRSSMSSIFRLPIYIMPKEELINLDFNLIATSIIESKNIRDYEFKDKDIVIIGNEAKGVSDFLMKKSEFSINIPISDRVNSLNANVAASIIIYEMTK
ncbi:TrmH family RNA methyltransferase [Peptoniphilus olsenii]|uniref:TrmH family RNA methyltransferase n=1 Tax=Peptoniphilus olsenii TaxID=411570 RepID=A0ABV2J8R5_9FIRM